MVRPSSAAANPKANWTPLEHLGRVLCTTAVNLDGFEEKSFLDCFGSNGLDFGELTVAELDLTFYSFAGKRLCSPLGPVLKL